MGEMDAYRSVYEAVSEAPPEFTLERLIPWGDFIVVKRLPKKEETDGGLAIPEAAQLDQDFAVVLKVSGIPEETEVGDIAVGDTVWFRDSANGGSIELKDVGEVLLILPHEDILAVLGAS
jgi:co-chaperonin GroES (HSP10)